ncbi:hypothetical protein PoB_004051800 [Plakobranchus ocellatus]|uniref:Uncharacterized protein n=1 Tax=Plakobranchus ocellatus TaxID=259542 RepID=A0AAV4B4K5_9GAST|nr:hypothetical protein PoB_004051800 [Plakobranchus ocellatus]
MRDVCSKLPKTARGEPAFGIGEQCVNWQFYNASLFTKDQFIGRNMNSLFQEPASQISPSESEFRVTEDSEEPELVSATDHPTTSRPAGSKTSQKRTHKVNARPHVSKKARQTVQLLQIEREKLGSLRGMLEEDCKKPADEWKSLVDHLVRNLRKIKNPYIIMSVKNTIG